MGGRAALTALFALTCLGIPSTLAQEAKAPISAHSVAGTPAQSALRDPTAELNSKQLELIQKVSAYFNQMSSLRGEFVQTSAGGNRLRGKFYVKRPGRFRFDFARPSRLVIVSDGQLVAIQDHDLKTDDRWPLDQTPFGVLLRQDVNLLRDARFFEVAETGDTIVIAFEDKTQLTPGALKMFLTTKPALELRKWITKDFQGLDTVIQLSGIVRVVDFAPDMFKPAPVALERLR